MSVRRKYFLGKNDSPLIFFALVDDTTHDVTWSSTDLSSPPVGSESSSLSYDLERTALCSSSKLTRRRYFDTSCSGKGDMPRAGAGHVHHSAGLAAGLLLLTRGGTAARAVHRIRVPCCGLRRPDLPARKVIKIDKKQGTVDAWKRNCSCC